ncbi:hypothetical protein BFC19_05460 [Brochothrix thermosphacta]|uniref:immunoglobulin-like domain-containing protein n=1 Tax=Brochothrix thermosphacta TaxID=2756 RepID=UPI000E724B86|nr:immunoglobulin-like domain-containing protein [Brochothrix thermosphacta]ANZ94866.1 hypothetical protein BFC19_05460 [Brochothrix thermosphacta]
MRNIKFTLAVLLTSSFLTGTMVAETEASTGEELNQITTNNQTKKTPNFNQMNLVQMPVELKQSKDVITPVLQMKNSVLYDTQPYDGLANFVTGTDENGDVIDKDNPRLTISGFIDMKTPGDYTQTATYSYNGDQKVTSDFVVTVKKDQTSISVDTVNTAYVYRGKNTQLKIEDIIEKVTDKDGNELTTYETVNGYGEKVGHLFKNGECISYIDDSMMKTYPYNYLYVENANGDVVNSKFFTIRVIADYTSLKTKNIVLYQGAEFDMPMLLKSAKNVKGEELGIEDVYYTSGFDQPDPETPGDSYHPIDTSKVGDKSVAMFIYDTSNNRVGDLALVEVRKDYTSFTTKDVTINKGEKYDASMGYEGGRNKDGDSLDFDNNMCWATDGIEVDPNKAGVYHVTYGVENGIGKLITQEKTVTVIDEADLDK